MQISGHCSRLPARVPLNPTAAAREIIPLMKHVAEEIGSQYGLPWVAAGFCPHTPKPPMRLHFLLALVAGLVIGAARPESVPPKAPGAAGRKADPAALRQAAMNNAGNP